MNTLRVAFWVTEDCNMKCIYCYEGNEKKNSYMTNDVAEASIEYAIKCCEKYEIDDCIFHFHGGEPLLAYDVIKHISGKIKEVFPKRIARRYSITTNGTIMNEEISSFLIREFDDISISIDGDKKSHDMSRIMMGGEGSFDTVLHNCRLLISYKSLRARLTITPQNISMLSDNIIFLLKEGFKDVSPALDLFCNEWTQDHMNMFLLELTKVRKYLLETNTKAKVFMVTSGDIKPLGYCTGGRTNINIDSEGNIFPCTYTVGKSEYICGTVFDGIDEEKIAKIEVLHKKTIPECAGCTLYNYCLSSRCKIINKCLTGNYLKPSAVVCASEHIRYKMLI